MKDLNFHPSSLSRREFLNTIVTAASAAAFAGVGVRKSVALGQSRTPGVEASTSPNFKVAIVQAREYDYKAVYRSMRDLLDLIGGLRDTIRPGDKVAVKVNLTGGVRQKPLPGVSPLESYVTHPQVTRVLCELLKDAGAAEVSIIEAVPEWKTFQEWDYTKIAKATGTRIINLNETYPFKDYTTVAPTTPLLAYPEFILNRILDEVDVMVSLSKMKSHYNAGVTHTMKNLVGLVPLSPYRTKKEHNYRSALHSIKNGQDSRIAKVIIDLNSACPIRLGLIDGIKSIRGGEAPWIPGTSPIEPGLLIAGKSAISVDAVATAVMGYDPTAEHPAPPFLRSRNHLNMAKELGLGTNRLEQIEVFGCAINDVLTPFGPS